MFPVNSWSWQGFYFIKLVLYSLALKFIYSERPEGFREKRVKPFKPFGTVFNSSF